MIETMGKIVMGNPRGTIQGAAMTMTTLGFIILTRVEIIGEICTKVPADMHRITVITPSGPGKIGKIDTLLITEMEKETIILVVEQLRWRETTPTVL